MTTPKVKNRRKSKNYTQLFSKLKTNKYLEEIETSKWLKCLNNSMKQHTWHQNVMQSFVKKDQFASIQMSCSDLWSIANEQSYIEDPVLDAVLNDSFKDHKQIGFIETSVFNAIENPYFSETTVTPFKNDKDAYVAVKNINNNHWIFVFLNFLNKTLYVVDPRRSDEQIETARKVMKAFKQVHHNEINASETSKWNFMSDEWNFDCIQHNIQRDFVNCGIYCMEYALKVKNDFPIKPSYLLVESNFNDKRQFYTAMLLNVSKPKLKVDNETIKEEEKEFIEHPYYVSKSLDEDGLGLVITLRRKKLEKTK